ncbi:pre-mRNA splicing factor slt-11 [Pseudovirgaria hyperparasitica]|uniref:Pre-mRNA splicing factor slt-11 n=1 Tax=Pseudovirgaria hyperparasitica TaxID=470096 RepID=A0A6A6WGN9_9PEZI|nr:pre-mRNA splicing factor slt-11 [Pseudovirgaria hyperparasitica]KAF2761244.1 pre-mRNA splicing factor slt-11 [Pseudovirgaria hyperparasitica]
MAPQIKQDLNRSGWETTDFPSVCERCLPDNPYVQMLKSDHAMECKICTRPFTLFTWKADRTSRQKRTNMCLTCARLKNCCQCCMLDLQFGLPIVIRDQALKMIAPGPNSAVNREYYAQNHEKEIEEGRGAILEAYEKSDDKAKELLTRLARSEPYRRQRAIEDEKDGKKALPAPSGPGPIRTRDTRGARGGMRGGQSGRGVGIGGGGKFPSAAQLPPQPHDILPPADPNIVTLFVTGVDEDLPEHELRTFFTQYGTLRSLVCSHRAHCAFINYATRKSAESAADACQGRAVVRGCPLRVQWGKPKPLDNTDHEERLKNARAGRQTAKAIQHMSAPGTVDATGRAIVSAEEDLDNLAVMAAPPGQDDEANYASLAGN